MREYYYWIDQYGELFHDDSALTDTAFLRFFFSRIKPNDFRYIEKYPYISPCGPEMNFIQCESAPIVFSKLKNREFTYQGGLKESINVTELRLRSGQIFHPAGKYRINAKLSGYLLIQFSEWIEQLEENTYKLSIPGEQVIVLKDEFL